MKKGGLESMSENNSEKVPKRHPLDQQKHGFRAGGVTKITKSRDLDTVSKLSRKVTQHR